jgi:hypothetical protein
VAAPKELGAAGLREWLKEQLIPQDAIRFLLAALTASARRASLGPRCAISAHRHGCLVLLDEESRMERFSRSPSNVLTPYCSKTYPDVRGLT